MNSRQMAFAWNDKMTQSSMIKSSSVVDCSDEVRNWIIRPKLIKRNFKFQFEDVLKLVNIKKKIDGKTIRNQ